MNDPILTLIGWLQNGANLAVAEAIAAQIVFVRYLGVPGLKYAIKKTLHRDLEDKPLVISVYVVAFILAFFVNLLTQQHTPVWNLLAMAYGVGNGAIGLHATGKVLTRTPDKPTE